jgi:hypothetical protein
MTINTPQLKPRMYQNSHTLELDEPDEEVLDANSEENPEGSTGKPEANLEPEPQKPEEQFFKNRYDSLKAHHDKTVRELRDAVVTLQEQLKGSASKQFELPESKEELEQWRKEYPDLYRIVRNISRLEATETSQTLAKQVEEVKRESAQAAHDRAMALLIRLHPDFPELSQSKEFHEWLSDQPSQIQSWLYEGSDPHLAGKAVSMYKAETGISKKKKQPDNDASFAVRKTQSMDEPSGNKPKIWKASEIGKLTSRQFEKLEAEIDLAYQEGRVDPNS